MSDRVERVALTDGSLRAEVLAKGGHIASLRHLPSGHELLARAPWSDETPDDVPMASSSSEWHRRYPGGWHLLLPRPGDTPTGVEPVQPFHGEAAWRTWRLQEVGAICHARVLLRTVPLEVDRIVRLDAGAVVVETEVRNVSSEPVRIGWAEHPAFAGHIFDDSRVVTGGRALDIDPVPSAGFADVDGSAGHLAITSTSAGLRLDLEWDPERHPRLFVWRERRGSGGFPWWGAMDAVGLEPSSDPYGMPTDALGSVPVPPGASVRSRLRLRVSGIADPTA